VKNKLTDLNDHLFAQLERLADENITGDGLKTEIARSRAVADMAQRITEAARLQLEVVQIAVDYPTVAARLPMLGNQ